MLWVTIFGATGYTGAVLTKLIANHPKAQISALISHSQDGINIKDIYPAFNGLIDCKLDKCNTFDGIDNADVIFTALPHGKGVNIIAEAKKLGKKVIDLSADYRLDQAEDYLKWYDMHHPYKELLKDSVYGLPEINKDKIKNAGIVANPGCYPTSILLGLAPVVAEGMIDLNSIIIDSKSGVSGAGKSGRLEASFVEVNENIKAYNIGSHRHTPEIEQELSKLSGKALTVTFSPHLIPVNRGILSTIYVKPLKPIQLDPLIEAYKAFYKDAPFVRILEGGKLPQTKWVSGSNYCDIGFAIDERTGRIVIVTALDNLMKGAAGQAVQNMNLMFGLEEGTGLQFPGMVP